MGDALMTPANERCVRCNYQPAVKGSGWCADCLPEVEQWWDEPIGEVKGTP